MSNNLVKSNVFISFELSVILKLLNINYLNELPDFIKIVVNIQERDLKK